MMTNPPAKSNHQIFFSCLLIAIIVVLSCIFLFFICGGSYLAALLAPTPTPITFVIYGGVTEADATVTPTPTGTITPTPTPTPTNTPTNIPTPTNTPLPKPTSVPTAIPPTPTATLPIDFGPEIRLLKPDNNAQYPSDANNIIFEWEWVGGYDGCNLPKGYGFELRIWSSNGTAPQGAMNAKDDQQYIRCDAVTSMRSYVVSNLQGLPGVQASGGGGTFAWDVLLVQIEPYTLTTVNSEARFFTINFNYVGPFDPAGEPISCSQFTRWVEAQSFYEAAKIAGTDHLHNLAVQNDIACPILLPPSAPQATGATHSTSYTGPYDPSGEDRNCEDFENWAQAQAFYEAAQKKQPTDRHNLDPDGDDLACYEYFEPDTTEP